MNWSGVHVYMHRDVRRSINSSTFGRGLGGMLGVLVTDHLCSTAGFLQEYKKVRANTVTIMP